jgi:hypothetical protein
MLPVSDWLEQLGMSEYAQRFAENDIDFSIPPELTDQDLEKIGVASLGHRRKILRAVAALAGEPSAQPALQGCRQLVQRFDFSRRIAELIEIPGADQHFDGNRNFFLFDCGL